MGGTSVSEGSGQQRHCPCCGAPLPLGLFSHRAMVKLPAAVEGMRENAIPVAVSEDGHVIGGMGRSFIACLMPLPLAWDESPVRCIVWVETDGRYARKIAAGEGIREGLEGYGNLACNVPGWGGTMGARVTFRCHDGENLPRIITCADRRMRNLRSGGHDDLVSLYRRCFGAAPDEPLTPADLHLRAAIHALWTDVAGAARSTFRQPVEPPPRFAGIRPAELLIAPPVDTGGQLIAATLGNAEGLPDEDEKPGVPRRVELAVFANDPSEGFLGSFSEFCYFSRNTGKTLALGQLVADREIPDTNGMNGWLICEPWWTDNWVAEGEDVRLLAAVPTHADEYKFVQERGTRELMHVMQMSDVDVGDLHREPVVSI